jgi:uncharacterized protein YqeY|nr:MAG: aspartyl-tRNA amidotransferase subunit B [Bacteroidota bacterium]
MRLSERLQTDLKEAMRQQDMIRLDTLRLIRAELMEQAIAKGYRSRTDFPDELVLEVLQRQAKKRREAIAQFEAAGRMDLAERERRELAIIESYLPQPLSEEELRAFIQSVIAELGASGPGDLGRVMSTIMPRLRGRADGSRVQRLVREALEGR